MLTAIICTYNRAKYIGPLLESIAANDLAKEEYEVLLVDNNCTDNIILIKGKMVLLQHGHALTGSNIYGTLGRLNITGKQLQKGGFTSTVGTNNAIAVSRSKLNGNVLKEHALTELECNTTC